MRAGKKWVRIPSSLGILTDCRAMINRGTNLIKVYDNSGQVPDLLAAMQCHCRLQLQIHCTIKGFNYGNTHFMQVNSTRTTNKMGNRKVKRAIFYTDKRAENEII